MIDLFRIVGTNITAIAVIVLVVLAGFFLSIFHKEIRGVLNRWNAETVPASGQKLSSAQSEMVIKAEGIINIRPESVEAEKQAAEFARILSSSPHNIERQLELALIDLANHFLKYNFEVAYCNIYGSQLDALHSLRKDGPQPLAKFHQAFLGRVQESFGQSQPPPKIDFETWVRFLTGPNQFFITLEGGIATITDRGAEFLNYISIVSLTASPRSF